MSHFTVMVPASSYEDLERILEPFEESPELGSPYIEFVDETEDLRKAWNGERGYTYNLIRVLVDPDGNSHYCYDDRFYTKPLLTQKDRAAHSLKKVINGVSFGWEKPEGWTEKSVIPNTIFTFDEFAEKYGSDWNEEEESYGYWRNPNAQWDWWQVGGRWTGLLKKLPQAVATEAINGSPGIFTERNEDPTRADCLLKRHIDIEFHKNERVAAAGETWDQWHDGERPEMPDGWHAMTVEERRAHEYFAEFNKWSEKYGHKFTFFDISEMYDLDHMEKEEYCLRYGAPPALTWAFIDLDGRWNDRGRMMWFGMSNKENDDSYHIGFWKWFESLPDDTLLWVVDAHI